MLIKAEKHENTNLEMLKSNSSDIYCINLNMK